MIEGQRVLGLIPARGGSKGVPRKNLRTVAGRPLLEWTVRAAAAAQTLDRLVLSSDDEAIIECARLCGCDVPFVRPAFLASDEAGSVSVVEHALDALDEDFDLVVLLQPTSPLRLSEDIDGAVEVCVRGGVPSCVSVTPVSENPSWMYRVDADGLLIPVLTEGTPATRRQDLSPVMRLNGAVYVARTGWFRATRSFIGSQTLAWVMPLERSLDIDTEQDLLRAEVALASRSEVRTDG